MILVEFPDPYLKTNKYNPMFSIFCIKNLERREAPYIYIERYQSIYFFAFWQQTHLIAIFYFLVSAYS